VPLGKAVTALGLVLRPNEHIVGLAADAGKDHRTAGIFVVHRDNLLKSEMESHYIEKTSKKQDPSCSDGSKNIVIGEVLHDVLHTALENVAQPVDGIYFHILIFPKTVQL
jgi:hypothetical protein